MDRIEGSSTARAATWNDAEYDKPLPGAAQKTAANIANAPWLSDAAVGTKGVPGAYPAAIFSNPAMYGPAVSLAEPPAPAAPKPEPLAAAPNSLKGITLANVAAKLPTGTRTDSTRDWVVKTVTNTSATFIQSVAVADRLKATCER